MAAHKVLLLTATLLLLLLVSGLLAAPQLIDPQAAVPVYQFGYQVKAPEFGNDFGHAEQREGPDTSGQYRVLLPDGRLQVVSYTVTGDSGYVAQVSYQ